MELEEESQDITTINMDMDTAMVIAMDMVHTVMEVMAAVINVQVKLF